jgi:hypothetical protein
LKPRNTLIVVALFALLFGYVYFIELSKTPGELGTPMPSALPQIFQLGASNIQSIEVRDLRAPREIKVTRAESGWQIERPTEKVADSPKIDSALSRLVNLQSSRVLTNVTDLAPFGFVTATLEVRLVMSDTTPYALTVGDKTPDGYSYYAVYTGDKSKVFIINSSVMDDLVAWLDTPPYQPTPTPTFTPSPIATPTTGIQTITPGATSTTLTPPSSVPETATPKP